MLLFAVACGLSVANVYYAQPLLDVLGAEFAIGQAGVGLLFGATQAGCALALLLVVPLGDLLERRRLMFVQLLLLVLSLLLVGFAGDTLGLALGLLRTGPARHRHDPGDCWPTPRRWRRLASAGGWSARRRAAW